MCIVSIIIPVHPAHNREDILGTCLKSLINQTYPKENTEIIIIGDGCRIENRIVPMGMKASVYNFDKRVGAIITRNRGIRLCVGELVAFIDADAIAEKTWLEKLTEGFDDPIVGGCGGSIPHKIHGCINKDLIRNNSHIYPLPLTSLCNAMFRKDVLNEISYLDENLLIYADDIDLSWRICLKGYHIKYTPGAVVNHLGVGNLGDAFLTGKARRALVAKYKKAIDLSFCLGIKINMREMFYCNKSNILALRLGHNIIMSFGYINRILEEWFRMCPHLEFVELTDKFLRPANLIKPLEISSSGRYLIKPNYILWWKAERGFCVVDLKNRKRYELEDVAARMWKCVIGNYNEEEIASLLLQEYDIDVATSRDDLKEFIAELQNNGVLEFS